MTDCTRFFRLWPFWAFYSWPFQGWKRDLHLGYQEVTWKKLVSDGFCSHNTSEKVVMLSFVSRASRLPWATKWHEHLETQRKGSGDLSSQWEKKKKKRGNTRDMLTSRWFKPWPFWDGEFTRDPNSKVGTVTSIDRGFSEVTAWITWIIYFLILEPQTTMYKGLFQLDDSQSLHRKWLFHQTSMF